MTVLDFVSMEKSGAMYRVVDASRAGYMTTKDCVIEADRNVIKDMFANCELVGFEPKGSKLVLYVKLVSSYEYKGYGIDFNVYCQNEYTVQYCGDDLWFKTIEEAKKFIDSIEEG